MKRLLVCIFLLSATVAQANTVTVVSGEHDTFSRLVLELPADSDWQLGRTDTGYALKLGLADPRYDVSTVFDLIPRNRLVGIFSDPRTGDLQLQVQCDCHAMPFSLDARTIVIDLRDGPAPATSSFELSLAGDPMPPLQTKTAPRPAVDLPPRPGAADYDWLAQPAPAASAMPVTLPIIPAEDFSGLQQALVEQMAEGAARGVVDLALPPGGPVDGAPQPMPDATQLRLTNVAGMTVASQRPKPGMMQGDGAECIADDRLNIADWGQITDVPGQLSRARLGLVGEFDKPDPAAVAMQVQLYLYLGFGAEAAGLLNMMPPDHPDAPLWSAMAQIIDGEPVTSPAFDGMAGCDSFAALWSLLSAPDDAVELADTAGLQRAFSALPQHLRLHLGPQVTDRLLALNRPGAVQGIADAMNRGATGAAAATLLVESDLDLHNGAEGGAMENAEAALQEGGVSAPAALVALVNAQIAAGAEIDPESVVALTAMMDEYAGTAIAQDIADARQLAMIGSGQFASVRSETDGPLPAVFWDVLATRGSDDDLLQHAFVRPDGRVPMSAATKIAERLQTLGFSEAAESWRQDVSATAENVTPDPGDQDDVAATGPADPPDDATRAQRWQQDWAGVAANESDPWKDLAAQVASPAPQTGQPPLAEATRLVEGSKSTRAMIEGVLQSTVQPGG